VQIWNCSSDEVQEICGSNSGIVDGSCRYECTVGSHFMTGLRS
jgi:hypothetical protein